jgi:hypothetical protein
MKIVKFTLLIFIFFGLLGFSNAVFAAEPASASAGGTFYSTTTDVPVHSVAPVLKYGRGIDIEDIQEFMALPLEDKVFIILFVVAIVAFLIWYVMMGRHMGLILRIPIVIVWTLLILVPTYLLGNMIWFVAAAITIVIVLLATWYEEHGKKMSKPRLTGTILGVFLLLCLVVGLPTYYYFTASEDITDVTVSSDIPGLEIIDYRAYRNTFGGTSVEFGGYVKNNGDKSVEYVKVNALGYDAQGKFVANTSTFIDEEKLFKGTSSKFGYLSDYYPGSIEDPNAEIVSVKLVVIDAL